MRMFALQKSNLAQDCFDYHNPRKYFIITRDASIQYSGSVLAPMWSFSADQVSVRRDRSKSDFVRILFCVIVEPHEMHKNIIKHHKVFMH